MAGASAWVAVALTLDLLRRLEGGGEDHRKPWFSGDYHHVRGGLWRVVDGPSKPVYTFGGQWTAATHAIQVATQARVPLSDVTVPAVPPQGRPAAELTELDSPKACGPIDLGFTHHRGEGGWDLGLHVSPPSPCPPPPRAHPLCASGPPLPRRPHLVSQVWGAVSTALLAGDYATATQAKTEVEDRQRRIRRERDESGTQWQPEHFHPAHTHEKKHHPLPALPKESKDGKDLVVDWVHRNFPSPSDHAHANANHQHHPHPHVHAHHKESSP